MILDVTTMKALYDLHGTIYYMFLPKVHAKFSLLTLNNIYLTTCHIMQKLTWGLNFHIDITIFFVICTQLRLCIFVQFSTVYLNELHMIHC